MKARLLDQNIEVMRRPEFDVAAAGVQADIVPEVRFKIDELYLQYLIWQTDPQAVNRKMNELQKWLARIVSIDGYSLKWLVARVNTDPEIPAYTLADFWVKSVRENSSAMVVPGFTRNGKESIDSFIVEMESALAEPLILAGKKQDFYTWYETAYLDAWLAFINRLIREGKGWKPARNGRRFPVRSIRKKGRISF